MKVVDKPEEVEVSRRETEIKSVSMGVIRFDNPELLFDYLDLMMGKRFVKGMWLVPSKGEPDPRYPEGHVSQSPEGIYTSIIIPQYHKGKFVYYIDAETFDQIREKIEPLIKEAFNLGERVDGTM